MPSTASERSSPLFSSDVSASAETAAGSAVRPYASAEEDKKSKYLAPLMETDYSNQPDTLILTAECDPLRDEGEEYGRRLKEAGNKVEVHRIQDALHGFFALGVKYYHVQESFAIINRFLSGYTSDENSRKVSPANEE